MRYKIEGQDMTFKTSANRPEEGENFARSAPMSIQEAAALHTALMNGGEGLRAYGKEPVPPSVVPAYDPVDQKEIPGQFCVKIDAGYRRDVNKALPDYQKAAAGTAAALSAPAAGINTSTFAAGTTPPPTMIAVAHTPVAPHGGSRFGEPAQPPPAATAPAQPKYDMTSNKAGAFRLS